MSEKKYSQSFLREVERFDRCNRQVGSPSQSALGLFQFFEYESKGVSPNPPDPYFTHLINGKAWWEWTLNEYAKRYLTDEWHGWYTLAKDFINDEPGFRQLRQRCGAKPMSPKEFLAKLPNLEYIDG